MSNSEISEKIAKLEKELAELRNLENRVTSFSYSKITKDDLKKLFQLERNFDKSIFNSWFNSSLELSKEDNTFLETLLKKEVDFLQIYKEEDLKVKFLSLILNRVDFKIDYKIRDFYEEPLVYETEKFRFSGTTDFLVSYGFEKAERPFFFIQEFKKGMEYSNPEPQLLAEMIAGLEISEVNKIKGAYIIGAIWNFVILEKVDDNSYRYWISQNFDSSDLEKLKLIYKNLLFIKSEILEMV
jgi:hypothetical protein